MARLVAYGHADLDSAYMGIGPVAATRLAVGKPKLTISDLDIIESSEAFAAQACVVSKQLGF